MIPRPTFKEERKLWKKGYRYIVGLDEVGRGAFAGPVTAGGVVFDSKINELLTGEINDSKLLRPRQRQNLTKLIIENAFCSSIASSSVSIINKKGVGKATQIAFRKVLKDIKLKLKGKKIFVFIDGFYVKYLNGVGLKKQKAIIKGDQKSISIAAASIIAKVHRDRIMKSLHKKYPQYGFGKHKGYGTKKHREAIKKYGLTKIHRKSFNLSKFT